jgi:MscS family membrane protein
MNFTLDDLNTLISSYPWIVQVVLIAIFTVIIYFLVRGIAKRLQRRLQGTRNLWDDSLLQALRPPLSCLIWLMGSAEIIDMLKSEKVVRHFMSVDTFKNSGMIALMVWFFVRYISLLEERIVSPVYTKKPVDHASALAIGKLLRGIAVVIALLVILQSFGYSVSGLLAIGGFGGIILGLASKDLVANFFGGLMIHLDRPFKVGDWIRSNNQDIEGIVEDIGWRITRIRTFDKRPVYVPNATFMSLILENPSRMTHRRINELVHLRHEDAGRVPAIIADLQELLLNHADIDLSSKIMVHLTSFMQSALSISVTAHTRIIELERFTLLKQDILLKILDVVSRHEGVIVHPAGGK